ncbi:HNH endonuclease [Caulobacter phage CcrColossus]|uniref:Putative HNH endonuclease n=1 Tax=Caulobacter phage CcrColossus TaxID=1211640 RepID=K4K6G9_9CAUD|nr:HNH endonuclease [Caulobacter phage CcrColossus]AFU88147.1 putative HNH endonuclease [Caulobacter phage CcrColossus]
MIEVPGIRAFGFVPGYERKGLYSIEEVHAHIGPEPREFDGDMVPMASQRYVLFARAHACVRCGLVGAFYAKERSARYVKSTGEYRPTTNSWHFNLYALTDGPSPRAVLMTKDHIVPRARGGADVDENYQPMCSPCNTRKGHRIEGESDEEFQASPAEVARRRTIEEARARKRDRHTEARHLLIQQVKRLCKEVGLEPPTDNEFCRIANRKLSARISDLLLIKNQTVVAYA